MGHAYHTRYGHAVRLRGQRLKTQAEVWDAVVEALREIPEDGHGPNEDLDLEVARFFSFCIAVWAMYQATILGRWLPDYYL